LWWLSFTNDLGCPKEYIKLSSSVRAGDHFLPKGVLWPQESEDSLLSMVDTALREGDIAICFFFFNQPIIVYCMVMGKKKKMMISGAI